MKEPKQFTQISRSSFHMDRADFARPFARRSAALIASVPAHLFALGLNPLSALITLLIRLGGILLRVLAALTTSSISEITAVRLPDSHIDVTVCNAAA